MRDIRWLEIPDRWLFSFGSDMIPCEKFKVRSVMNIASEVGGISSMLFMARLFSTTYVIMLKARKLQKN